MKSKRIEQDSTVMKSYNSYRGSVKKREAIQRVLKKYGYPLSPKQIAKEAQINHSTVRVYLRQLHKDGEVSRPIYGFYQRKPTPGVSSAFGVRVHYLNFVVACQFLHELVKIPTVVETLGSTKFEVRFGKTRKKISAWVTCEVPGLDYQSFLFAMQHFRDLVKEKTGFEIDPKTVFEKVNCEFNEDYLEFQMEGIKSITVRDFMGNLERVYNKGNVLRSEARLAESEKLDIPKIMTILKGGEAAYTILQCNVLMLNEMKKMTKMWDHSMRLQNSSTIRQQAMMEKMLNVVERMERVIGESEKGRP